MSVVTLLIALAVLVNGGSYVASCVLRAVWKMRDEHGETNDDSNGDAESETL